MNSRRPTLTCGICSSQVLDAGRLTDAIGQTADFRHSIIILTSNLGATRHLTSGLGFTPQADAFSQEQILRAVQPELPARVHQPARQGPRLSPAVARTDAGDPSQGAAARIRSGEGCGTGNGPSSGRSSALDFLLDRGFSPEMGARPLKRAIDQHLLAPLAATIVEHRFPAGDQFLFVRSDGKDIEVEFVNPDAESTPTKLPSSRRQRPRVVPRSRRPSFSRQAPHRNTMRWCRPWIASHAAWRRPSGDTEADAHRHEMEARESGSAPIATTCSHAMRSWIGSESGSRDGHVPARAPDA